MEQWMTGWIDGDGVGIKREQGNNSIGSEEESFMTARCGVLSTGRLAILNLAESLGALAPEALR